MYVRIVNQVKSLGDHFQYRIEVSPSLSAPQMYTMV